MGHSPCWITELNLKSPAGDNTFSKFPNTAPKFTNSETHAKYYTLYILIIIEMKLGTE